MVLTPLEYTVAGIFALQVLTAAVSAMNPPMKTYGPYLYMYKFLRQVTNLADAAFEKKFNVVMPRVDQPVTQTATQIAIQSIATQDSQIDTAVTKTTTTF